MAMRSKRSQARLPHMLTLLTIIADTDNSRVVGHNVTLNRSEQRLEKIRTFCACNYARNIPLAEVAAYAGMNKSAFCTFMKRHTGTTFSDYMNTHRLKIALDRLRHTDDNISDIAYSVGFSNVSYFNRLFKSKYSRTPASLRSAKLLSG